MVQSSIFEGKQVELDVIRVVFLKEQLRVGQRQTDRALLLKLKVRERLGRREVERLRRETHLGVLQSFCTAYECRKQCLLVARRSHAH